MAREGDQARDRIPGRERDAEGRPGAEELEGLPGPRETAPPEPGEVCPW